MSGDLNVTNLSAESIERIKAAGYERCVITGRSWFCRACGCLVVDLEVHREICKVSSLEPQATQSIIAEELCICGHERQEHQSEEFCMKCDCLMFCLSSSEIDHG